MSHYKNCEYDCTRKCRYRQHGNVITAALTKRAIADDKLAAFIAKTCCNFGDIVDDLGRSAVHLAASVNRYAILEWLLNKGAIINGRDFESGSSTLHRAIYYGCIDCAVLLIRYGASLELLDEDTRCALQMVCRMRDFPSKTKVAENNEILVWGSNKNYNLGIGNEEGASSPQSIDFFRKEHTSIEAVALGTYHSLFLDKKSQLYAVGHGNGGRLGIGIENSLPVPKKVKVPIKKTGELIICISTSRKHSLLLTNRSTVYACGLNEDQQLGVRDCGAKLTVFKEVVTLRDFGVQGLVRVIAKDFFSLSYSNNCIYVWGTNNGQIGMNANVKTVPTPKELKLSTGCSIEFVEANNFATAVYTKENLILLYYNYKTKSIKTYNYEAIKSISLVGGDNTKSAKGSASALKMLILTQTNVVYMWYEKTQNFHRCIFSQIRLTQIDKIFYKANQVLILSQGDVYKGKCNQVAFPTVAHDEDERTTKRGRNESSIWSRCDQNRTVISKDHMIRIDLQRLDAIDRAVDIYCDDDFSSFAVLQESNMKYFKLPTLTPEEYSFKKLYNDVNEYDAVHDVVFHVDGETYAAHKLIVHARAPGLRDIISDYVDKHIYINYTHLTGKMLELMLKYMYTNYFPNEEDLDDIGRSLGLESPEERKDICVLFLNFVAQFQLQNLENYLKSFLQHSPFYLPHYFDKSKHRFNRFRRQDFPALYDVSIVCAGNIELQAHKCILVSRLEYFDMMFSHSWAEQTTINLSTVPLDYMEPILDFLYSSDVEQFRKQQYSTTFLYNMIVFCDQFFIERLRKVCEILILEKITIRKCGDMLDFANIYNCDVLRNGCLQFICQNLARVLTNKSLDCCEPDALKCINDYYRQMFKNVFDYRIITPDEEAVDDDLLLSFVDGFQVDLDYRMTDNETSLHSVSVAKQRENKSKQATRQYERDAISTMIESMNLNEKSLKSNKENNLNNFRDEVKAADAKLQAESKSWMKVLDKKDQKKKLDHEKILKANTVLMEEEKPKADFVSLAKEPAQEKTSDCSNISNTQTTLTDNKTSPAKVFNINLADLATTPREKLSQKQRKRLSSESWRSPKSPVVDQSKPMTVPAIPNAWGVVDASPSAIFEPGWAVSPTPPTGSAADATSFANMMRGGKSLETPANSFSKIIAEEKQQREYYERMRTKPLTLTQIEETAIAELREFYNADNVYDEIITIERRVVPRTMNFAVWKRN